MTFSGCKQGLAFSSNGIYYHFAETGKGLIPYGHLLGGFSSHSGLEVTLRDGNRLYFGDKYFTLEILGQLDVLLDRIAGQQ